MKHPIPPEALKRHTAILGMTGSGKSSTGRLMVEEVVAQGHRVCILDTIKSDWWGITSSRSGKAPGLPFKILGGPRGHLLLHSSAGKAIGQLVGSGKLPLSIIDMADFEPGGLQRFFVDFVPALMRSMKGVVYLVIEEGHEIAPKERAGFGAENMAIHFAKKLGTGGRTKGIRLIVATQRVQALHNAVLGSCETVIAHRIGFADDQVPVLKWMKAKIGKENTAIVEAELANLPDGVGFLASGAPAKIFERVKFPLFSTYDNTATPDGDPGEIDVKTAPVDPDELRAIIGDAVKEAEANDPRALRAEIVKLRQELTESAKAPAPAISEEVIDAAHAEGYQRGLAEGLAKGENRAKAALTAVADRMRDALAVTDGALGDLDTPMPTPSLIRRGLAETERRDRATALADARRRANMSTKPLDRQIVDRAPRSNGTLPKGERAVLIAAAQHPNGVTRQQLTVLTGYKRSSRDAYIQRLRERGYIDAAGDRIHAYDAGIRALGDDYQPLPTGAALREHVLRTLPEGERKVLELLIELYPDATMRETIDSTTGYKRSSRDAYLQRLSARELIAFSNGMPRASADLFD